MKKITLSLFCSLAALFATAQTPQAFKYQAVARDASGNELANTAITVQASIHDLTPGGTIVYQEVQSATTNQFGLFSINLGQGSPTVGTFSTIDWSTGAKYLQQEIDFGTGIQNMGTSELLSVPFALYAAGGVGATGAAGAQGPIGPIGPTGPQGDTGIFTPGTAAGNTPYWNGTSWVTSSSNIFNNGGDVGIGTSTPGHVLEVAGDVMAQNGFLTPGSQEYAYGAPKTRYLSVPAASFEAQGAGNVMTRALGINGTSVGTYGGTTTNTNALYAPINLPDGAVITKVTAYMSDNDAIYAASVSLLCVHNSNGGIGYNITTPTTTATTFTPYMIAANHTVTNTTEAYSLRFNTYEFNTNMLLCNVVVEYTVNKAD